MRALIALLTLLAVAPATAQAAAASPLERTREPAPEPGAARAEPTARAAALTTTEVRRVLSRAMGAAGRFSGAAVIDLTTGRALYRTRSTTPRIPASVEKLYTTVTALLRDGPEATFTTRVLGTGTLEEDGTYRGDLYLRGAGDPTFGSQSFTRRVYGAGATTGELAEVLDEAGIERVEGRVVADAGVFDAFPGVPDSGLRRPSPYVGALSGLTYDRAGDPQRAAEQLRRALAARKVQVSGRATTGAAPAGARELAASASPSMARLVAITNRPSDNFFAEMLIKGLGARHGGHGSTAAGAQQVRETLAAQFGIDPSVVDGSGLSRGNRTSPAQVVQMLDRLRSEDEAVFTALDASLPVAGRSGTLYARMRGTAAQDRCRAKTGTLSNVSALAGYCSTQGGELVAFAFLMNGVSVGGARRLQDRMAAAVARYDAEARRR